jgi:hypothetical protein
MIQECFRTSKTRRCSFCFRLAHSASFLFCVFPFSQPFLLADRAPNRALSAPLLALLRTLGYCT